MLITACSHCHARFRVTPLQLNQKQGQVRCGRCRNVFNGFESLERYPDDDTGSRLLAAREAAEKGSHPLDAIEPLPLEELPDIEAPEALMSSAPASLPPSAPARHPASEEPGPVSTPPRTSRSAESKPLPEEPWVVAPPSGPSRAWAFGVALLALVLAGELVFAFRSPVAQRHPVVRPWLESVCASVGCAIAWARDETLLKLEDSELVEVPGKLNEIALGARIRNLASVAQEYPHLELSLTDLTGQVAARRVIRPMDYLGRAVLAGEVLGPGAEIA
ncbi:MAG TPA: DUF3426 domain-containing protein, partial [Usitatibacter sp.]|nr:DUF3426 domain-containing protein [Usitatibacter sp.]